MSFAFKVPKKQLRLCCYCMMPGVYYVSILLWRHTRAQGLFLRIWLRNTEQNRGGAVSTAPVWWRIEKNTVAALLERPLRENQLVSSERKLGVNYHERGVGAQGAGPGSRREQGILAVRRERCLRTHVPHRWCLEHLNALQSLIWWNQTSLVFWKLIWFHYSF